MILFGPAGIPSKARQRTTQSGIEYCREIGLGAMEVEFVRGVNMGEEAARRAGAAAKKAGISLSCHAPYYINCCANKKETLDASVVRIVASAQAAFWLCASPVVIHTGYYMGRPQEECKKLAIAAYERCFEKMDALGIKGVALGAELTGKKSAYGSLEEIIDLSGHFGPKKLAPVIDFAHYHAREGRLKTTGDYSRILEKAESQLGSDATRNFHCHFSGIEFTGAGERRHLPIGSNSPPFEPLARAWKEKGWEGKAICESPLLENDALEMQRIWEAA